MPSPSATPLPSHQGVFPGQVWKTTLGGEHRVVACMSDGYIYVQPVTARGKDEPVKPIWIDRFYSWTISDNSPIVHSGITRASLALITS